MRFTWLLAILLASAPLHAATLGAYTFTLEGRDYNPGTLGSEEGDAPIEGDVVIIEGIPLTLDAPGKYDFGFHDGGLYRLRDGRETLVGCVIEARKDKPEKGKAPTVNPLATLDDAGLKALRGVRLEGKVDGFEAALGKLDLARVCLSVTLDNDDGRMLQHLPAELAHLAVSSSQSTDKLDLSGLAAMKGLKFLDLSGLSTKEMDVQPLRDLPLIYLSLPWGNVRNIEALAGMTSLRTLVANACRSIGSGSWLSSLKGLRQLYVGYLAASGEGKQVPLDLSSLAKLPALRAVHAQASAVGALPSVKMEKLTRLTLLQSGAPEASVAAFAAANPQCEVLTSLNKVLADRLKKADRIRVRTGGVCHREEAQEKTIFESRDAEVLAELAAHLGVNEKGSGFHCMCCGNPTFEFYTGTELVVTLGFHHGQSVRWSGGVWPGDGLLAEGNGEYLCKWLAEKGEDGPLKEFRDSQLRAKAARRRGMRYDALIPTALKEALEKADTLDDAAKAFGTVLPEPAERATLMLRLFGCDNGSWDAMNGWDDALVQTLIPSLPKEALSKAIAQAKSGTEEGQGAARWIFGEGNLKDYAGDWGLIERLARFALSLPKEPNRRRTMEVLRDAAVDRAKALLREVLRGKIKPGTLPEGDQTEPGGMAVFRPNALTLPEGSSDELMAALCLAMLKDAETASEVSKLRDGLAEEARKSFDGQVKAFQTPRKGE